MGGQFMRLEYGALFVLAIAAGLVVAAVLRDRARRNRALADASASLAALADAELAGLSRALDALAQGNLETALSLRARHLDATRSRQIGDVAAAHDVLVDQVGSVLARSHAAGRKPHD